MKTALITGCSSGFGLETARHFLGKGWNVIATMRHPASSVLLPSERLRILALDVTDDASIRRTIETVGQVDVLVNNAGVGLFGAFESQDETTVREVFETNVLGLMALTRAVLPQMRERRSGVVVNVASAVTLKAMPLLSVYTASKASVVAFTEVLSFELAPLNVQARVVLPGLARSTRFGANSSARSNAAPPKAYYPMLQEAMAGFQSYSGPVTTAQQVAETVWVAATDPAAAFALPAGDDAVALARSRQGRPS